MYIDNSFYGALESKDRVEQTLDDLLDVYREGGDETVAFESKITYEPGLYLTESIVSEDSIIRLITTKKTVAAYYTVVEGDSPLGVIAKLGMSEEELARLNPDFSLDSFLQIGDKLLITQEEPFLAVAVTRPGNLRREHGLRYRIRGRFHPLPGFLHHHEGGRKGSRARDRGRILHQRR